LSAKLGIKIDVGPSVAVQHTDKVYSLNVLPIVFDQLRPHVGAIENDYGVDLVVPEPQAGAALPDKVTLKGDKQSVLDALKCVIPQPCSHFEASY
jgi:hypothetical protein